MYEEAMTELTPSPRQGSHETSDSGVQNRILSFRNQSGRGGLPDMDGIVSEGGPSNGVSIPLLALIDVFRKRLWIVILLTLGVGAGVYQWSKASPKKYRASVTLEVVVRSPRVFTNIRDVVSFHYQVRRFYATQKVILESNEIAQKALNAVSWVLRSPGFYGLDKVKDKAKQRQLMEKLKPRAYLLLKARMSVAAIRRSSLFRITVTDTDPNRASQLAQAIADSYREYNLQFRLRATNNAYTKIKAQRDRFQKRYKDVDRKLVSFRQKNNLLTTSLNDRRNLAFKSLEEVNNRTTQVMLKRIELDSLLKAFQEKNGQLSNSFPPLLKHDIYWKLKENQSALVLRRENLLSRYKSKHPSVRQINRQLRRLNRILEGQKQLIFKSFLSRLRSAQKEERSLRRKVYIARKKLQKLERLNLYFARMNEQKKELEKSLAFLNRRFFEIQLLKDATATNVRIVERPRVPKRPFSPRVIRTTALGGFLGFLGFFGLFFLLELTDRSIRSMEDVELKTGLVPLGEVPLFRDKKKSPRELLYNPDRPLSQIEEAIRTIRTNVLFMTSDLPMRKILFTSPSPREGKTFIAVNMAIGIAHTGKKTILIDTDMRRPRVHKALELDYDRSKGVSSVLVGQHTLDEAMIDSGFPNLTFLPCGPIPPSPTELLQTENFYKMLAELEERFEVILFDSPPINHVADAAVLSGSVDGIILISSCGSTSWPALQGAARRIESLDGRILGCVLNKFSHKHRRGYYYGTYGGYYSPYRYTHYGLSGKEAEAESPDS